MRKEEQETIEEIFEEIDRVDRELKEDRIDFMYHAIDHLEKKYNYCVGSARMYVDAWLDR